MLREQQTHNSHCSEFVTLKWFAMIKATISGSFPLVIRVLYHSSITIIKGIFNQNIMNSDRLQLL